MSPSPLRSIPSPLRRFRRFVVADRSMEPTLVDGQGLIAVSGTATRPGQLRCVEHPLEPDFWLVKRVESVDGPMMRVTSDNREVDAIDSRWFGPVPTAGTYRVVLKVPRRLQ